MAEYYDRTGATGDRFLVWICCGCEECEPSDGSERSSMPCDGPSKDGGEVVYAADYDEALAEIDRLRRALDIIADSFTTTARIRLLWLGIVGALRSRSARRWSRMPKPEPAKSSTEALIAPILRGVYGKGSMVDALAAHLAEKIDAHEDHDPSAHSALGGLHAPGGIGVR